MKVDVDRVLEICDEFLKVPSVVGCEKPFLVYMKKRAESLGYKIVLRDNYLVVKSKRKGDVRVLFSAHIDRQGLILNDEGKVEYATNYFKKKLGIKFRRGENNLKEEELSNFLKDKLKNEKIDVVLDDIFLRFNYNEKTSIFFRDEGPNDVEKLALRYLREDIASYDVETGEILNNFKTLSYDLNWKENGVFYMLDKEVMSLDKVFMLVSSIRRFDNMFSGQIDNVISAAVIFYLLENCDFSSDVIFTCGEECGISYKAIIDYYEEFKVEDEKLVVLDTSPYSDFVSKKDGFLVLRHGDERGGFDMNLVSEIRNFLDEETISYDFKPSYMGRTELGKVALNSKGKINGVTLQLPSTNYHTSCETSSILSLENYVRVVDKISKN